MPDRLPTSWKRQGLKVVGALAATVLTAVAARYRLDAATWKETVARLPVWALALILAGAPVAWILFEFLAALFKELGVLASSGGKSAAQALGHAPEALKNVLGRAWDRVAACLSRRSFDGRYRRRLYEDYGLFNDRGLGLINAARLDLDRVYVELQIGSAQVVPTGMELLRHPIKGRHTVWDFLHAVRPGRGLVLIGPPGSGKTTLLQHLLLVFARNRQGRHGLRQLLPILIELRNLTEALKKRTPPTLADAIRSYWKTNSRIADLMKQEPTRWLEKRLRSSRVLLLLDGLDEVPQAERLQVSAWAQEQMRHEAYRRCLFLLTSRPGGYVDAPLTAATVLEVQPFNPEQTSKFIDGWYRANEIVASGNEDNEPVRRRATQEANDLRQRLRENPGIYELTVNPLLLTMVCMVHRYHGALPGSRSQLYGEICQVLLERWRHAKGITEELSGEQKLAVLRPLAEEFMRREAREMPEEDILPVIAAPLASVGYRGEGGVTAGQRFLRFIQASSGLLLEKERGRWCLAHKTFQEYLTAEHWLRNPNLLPDWADKVPSAWWRETLLLFAARTDASGLVDAALAEGSQASLTLTYQCLGEAQSLRPEVRVQAEATLRQSLKSDAFAVFHPAATAFHCLRQRELLPISEKVEQRTTLVTQAEYQLFLIELNPAERLEMTPPHWTSPRSAGGPEEPVLGVWPWQARRFAKWANRGASPVFWRLPAGSEPANLPTPTAAYWRSDHTLSPLPTVLIDMMDEWATQQHFGTTRAWTLEGAIDGALDCHALVRTLDIAFASVFTSHRPGGDKFDRELGDSFGLPLAPPNTSGGTIVLDNNFDLALSTNLVCALTSAFGSALNCDFGNNRSSDSDSAFDRDFEGALDAFTETLTLAVALDRGLLLAGNRALALAVILASALDFASALALARAFAFNRRHLYRVDLSEIRAIAEKIRQQVPKEGASTSDLGKRLLACLLDVVTAETDGFAVRRAWRHYGICLLDMARPHLSQKSLDELAPIEIALRLLVAREAGEVQPYEGILLVRDNDAP